MNKLKRDIWRTIFLAFLQGRWRTGWRNTRFMLGMWIGGFSTATRPDATEATLQDSTKGRKP